MIKNFLRFTGIDWIDNSAISCSNAINSKSIFSSITETLEVSELLISLLIPVLFYLLELRIKVTKEGLHYQFFPFHFKLYIIKTNNIEKIEALKYRPLMDYGGWGIRYGFKGKCYNVKGNLGVKVFLKNGSYILFGSQKYKELEKSLQKIIQQK